MKISDYDYNLPEEKIAIYPPEIRGKSKLLVLDRNTGKVEDRQYSDLSDYLTEGDVLVLNDTFVLKARLDAYKSTGGHVELIALEKHGINKDLTKQKVMYRGNLKIGDELKISNYRLNIVNILGNGIAEISCENDLYKISEEIGDVPIPPYMHRKSEKVDEERYQTVFAKNKGSVAAPTASLNFTEDLKKKLLEKGVKIVYITLHVGLGTFLPVREDDVEKHEMHSEYFEIPSESIKAIKEAKNKNKRIIALGTTVTRTLEFAAKEIYENDELIFGEANIFIYPGYKFRIVDQLITNFHAPRSTVLLLANAFAGEINLRKAYKHALENDYKFLSYGDSMLIL